MKKSIFIIVCCCILMVGSVTTISFSENLSLINNEVAAYVSSNTFNSSMFEIQVENMRNGIARSFLITALPLIMTIGAIAGVIMIPLGIFLWAISNKNTNFLLRGRGLVYGGAALIIVCKYVYGFIFPSIRVL